MEQHTSPRPHVPTHILILCTGNSCRSQMMHGYLQHFLGSKAKVYSAGIETHGLNKGAVAIMAKDGIDISTHTSNHVDEYADVSFDYMITVCDHANENCPYVPGVAVRLHHNFTDPSKVKGTEEEIEKAFKNTREAIKEYAAGFVAQYFN